MFPGRPLDARRRKVGLVAGAIGSCGTGSIAVLFGHPPPNAFSLLGLAFIFAANAGIVFYSWPATHGLLVPVRDRRNGRKKRHKSGPPGLGLNVAANRTSAPPAAGRHVALRTAARLMPRAPDRRWLAEAESLLFEMPTRQRAKAIRSYLLSAPRLLALLWARELSRRARRTR